LSFRDRIVATDVFAALHPSTSGAVIGSTALAVSGTARCPLTVIRGQRRAAAVGALVIPGLEDLAFDAPAVTAVNDLPCAFSAEVRGKESQSSLFAVQTAIPAARMSVAVCFVTVHDAKGPISQVRCSIVSTRAHTQARVLLVVWACAATEARVGGPLQRPCGTRLNPDDK